MLVKGLKPLLFRVDLACLIMVAAIAVPFHDGSYEQMGMPASKDDSLTAGYTLLHSIPVLAKDIQTDRLGNLFILSNTNQLYKHNPDGRLLSTLNYKYLGNISHVDPSNPLEIYLFYRELNTVVFLDNNLAYRGEINLSVNNAVMQASAAARSYDNDIWVFDLGDLQLKKVNKEGQVKLMSGNVRQLIGKENIQPGFIYDDNEHVYVNDTANGILVFDVFANYIRTIPIKGVDDFKLRGQELFYNRGRTLWSYHIGTYVHKEIPLPYTTDSVTEMSVEKERLYLMKNKSVEVYAIR